MKALQIATLFALLVSVSISNNVQPTEMLPERIPSREVNMLAERILSARLKMLGAHCSGCKEQIRNDKKRDTNKQIRYLPPSPFNLSKPTSKLPSP